MLSTELDSSKGGNPLLDDLRAVLHEKPDEASPERGRGGMFSALYTESRAYSPKKRSSVLDVLSPLVRRYIGAMEKADTSLVVQLGTRILEDQARRKVEGLSHGVLLDLVAGLVGILEDMRQLAELSVFYGGNMNEASSRRAGVSDLDLGRSTVTTGSMMSILRSPVCETNQVAKFTDTKGNKIINRYTVVADLGRGSFGKVKLAVNNDDGGYRAIKIINKSLLKRRSDKGSLNREIAIMKKLRHRNCVSLYEVIDDPLSEKLYLVMQYVSNGPVVRVKADMTCNPLPQENCLSYLRQLVSGLRYLHKHNVIHHDIKPDNILLGDDGTVYFSDFGVSEIVSGPKKTTKFGAGTPVFSAPEEVEGKECDGRKTDTWTLGVTIYIMLIGVVPFTGDTYGEVTRSIVSDPLPWSGTNRFGEPVDSLWKPIFEGVLQKNPTLRWDLSKLKQYLDIDVRSRVEKLMNAAVEPEEKEDNAVTIAAHAVFERKQVTLSASTRQVVQRYTAHLRQKTSSESIRMSDSITEKSGIMGEGTAKTFLSSGTSGTEYALMPAPLEKKPSSTYDIVLPNVMDASSRDSSVVDVCPPSWTNGVVPPQKWSWQALGTSSELPSQASDTTAMNTTKTAPTPPATLEEAGSGPPQRIPRVADVESTCGFTIGEGSWGQSYVGSIPAPGSLGTPLSTKSAIHTAPDTSLAGKGTGHLEEFVRKTSAANMSLRSAYSYSGPRVPSSTAWQSAPQEPPSSPLAERKTASAAETAGLVISDDMGGTTSSTSITSRIIGAGPSVIPKAWPSAVKQSTEQYQLCLRGPSSLSDTSRHELGNGNDGLYGEHLGEGSHGAQWRQKDSQTATPPTPVILRPAYGKRQGEELEVRHPNLPSAPPSSSGLSDCRKQMIFPGSAVECTEKLGAITSSDGDSAPSVRHPIIAKPSNHGHQLPNTSAKGTNNRVLSSCESTRRSVSVAGAGNREGERCADKKRASKADPESLKAGKTKGKLPDSQQKAAVTVVKITAESEQPKKSRFFGWFS